MSGPATPSLASPGLAAPDQCRASPCLAVLPYLNTPCSGTPGSPFLSRPNSNKTCHTSPASPRLTLPSLAQLGNTVSRPAIPALPILAVLCLAEPRHSATSLEVPLRATPILPCRASPSKDSPEPAVLHHTKTVHNAPFRSCHAKTGPTDPGLAETDPAVPCPALPRRALPNFALPGFAIPALLLLDALRQTPQQPTEHRCAWTLKLFFRPMAEF
jgi:hypothetical protein